MWNGCLACCASAFPPLSEPVLQQRTAFLGQDSTPTHHVMVGSGAFAQIQSPPQSPPLPVCCAKNHTPHARLSQGGGTHDAWLQGDQEGAIIKSPVSPQGCRLPQGHQFPMTEGIRVPFPLVAAPTNTAPATIQNDRSHRNLPGPSHHGCPAQQAPHPHGGEIVIPA